MQWLLWPVLAWCSLVSANAQSLYPKDFAMMERVDGLIDEKQFEAAYTELMDARETVRGDFGRALVLQYLADIDLQLERYPNALRHLTAAYALNALSEQQQTNALYTLAQLHCMEEQWQRCADLISDWLNQVPSTEHRSSHYLLLAQANTAMEKWPLVIDPVGKAIALENPAPMDWYQFKVAAQVSLKRWQGAISTQKALLSLYPDQALQWRRLVSFQFEVKQFKEALASQRIGVEQGLLREEKDYRLLAQLMLQEGIPFHGARILEEGMSAGRVKLTEGNLQLLATGWQLARDNQRLLVALTKLNELAPSLQRLEQLARVQIETEQWESAQATLRQGIARYGKESQARLQLLLGITHIQLETYNEARAALVLASQDSVVGPSANSWLRYLEGIEG